MVSDQSPATGTAAPHEHEWQPNGIVEVDRESKSPVRTADDVLWTESLSVGLCRCGAIQRTSVGRKNVHRRGP